MCRNNKLWRVDVFPLARLGTSSQGRAHGNGYTCHRDSLALHQCTLVPSLRSHQWHHRRDRLAPYQQLSLSTCISWEKANCGVLTGSPAISSNNQQFLCWLSRVTWPFFPTPSREEFPSLQHRGLKDWVEEGLPSVKLMPSPCGKGHSHQLSCLPQMGRDTHSHAEGDLSSHHPSLDFKLSSATAPSLLWVIPATAASPELEFVLLRQQQGSYSHPLLLPMLT